MILAVLPFHLQIDSCSVYQMHNESSRYFVMNTANLGSFDVLPFIWHAAFGIFYNISYKSYTNIKP